VKGASVESPDDPSGSDRSDGPFIRRVLIFLSLAALTALSWQFRDLLLLVFGAIVVAVILRTLSNPVSRSVGLPDWAAVLTAVIAIVGVVAGGVWLFGPMISAEVRNLGVTLPEAWRAFQARTGNSVFWERVSGMFAGPGGGGLLSGVRGYARSVGAGIADTVVVLVAGVYMAAQPAWYRSGALKLLPPGRRDAVNAALDQSGDALRQWLKAQLVSMLAVGVLTGLGLWVLGVPSALVLGLLAGVLEFIPLAGPVLAAIPALLLALTVDVNTALWAAGLMILIQQLEGNVIQPLVQRYAVQLPPALFLFALLGFAAMFGAVGIILAAPLTVVVYVLIKRLYVQEALGTPADLPVKGNRQQAAGNS
jgi:predicted PurR-regulated permease PerM